MTARDHAATVTHWLSELLMLTRGATGDTEDIKRRMKSMIVILAKDFPSEAFTTQSLHAVAGRFKFMPSYSELSVVLNEWWKASQPKPIIFDDPTLSAEDKLSVRSFMSFRAKDFDHLSGQATTLPGRMAISLGVFRRHSPGAFAYVCRTDAEANRIAKLRGWLEDDDPKKGWGNALAVTKAVLNATAPLPDGRKSPFAPALLGILRAAVGRYAPENLALIPTEMPHSSSQAASNASPLPQPPDDAQSRLRAEFRARHGREMGALTPEQLQAAYAARGTSGPPRPAPKASVPSWDHREDDHETH